MLALVFLGEDNSVKLGDFGLSKVMESHDFASTYVGTPFYMSPEICAAEKYTLKSDIWSLGCIIYELCTREPPFNAKTHYQLVQKIKEGKINPLPAVYSQELFSIIKDCLRVNPDRRPDTATLLNLPVVRLMRKEREVNDFNKTLKQKEESLNRRVKEVEQKAAALEQKAAALQQEKAALEQQKVALEQQKTAMRQEIEAAVRREWEVKARLEIDRLVALEIEQLHKKFEQEVQLRVEMELQKRKATILSEADRTDLSSSASGASSSISGRSADSELTSTTDATELTAESPDTSMHPLKRSVTRTPFTRAHTMFAAPVGTPMDIEMASPSPMTVQSLSLSPRRNFLVKPPTVNPGNIFAVAGESKDGASRRSLADSDTDADVDVDDANIDDDDIVPSPTRLIKHSNKNPFNPKQRPQLPAQQTVLPFHQRLKSKQSTATQGKTVTPAPSNSDFSSLRQVDSSVALQDRSNSPTRRVTKIPSTINMRNNATETATSGSSLLRNASLTKKDSCEHSSQNSQNINPSQPPCLNKVCSAPNSIKSAASVPSITTTTSCGNIRGRTLVELQQARAGGRPLSAVMSSDGYNPNCAHRHHHHHNHSHTHMATNTSSPVRAFREHAAAANRGIVPVTTASALASEPPAVWDPEKDDMPSPFLVRRKPVRA